jgi:Mn2+/Fe2+ NRAMP family transporter
LITVQSICARIGDVTKKGLATLIIDNFGQKIAFISMFILILANITTLGADFVGIGAGLHLLFPQVKTVIFLPLITLFLWWIVIFKSYKAFYKLLLILSAVFVAYILSGLLAKPDWGEVFKNTFWPKINFSLNYWTAAVAFLGTTITPFLFFWQITEEIENHPTVLDAKKEVPDLLFGIITSSAVTFFIIVASAAVFYNNHISIQTAADAAFALKPLAGNFASLLFAVGLIGSGFLAVPVIASSTAYVVAETFGWREGLEQRVSQARGFYTVLTATFLVGLVIALLQINPIKALFYSQVLNGVLASPLLALILILGSSEKIMGRYKNTSWVNFLGWLTVGVMSIATITMFVSF